MTGIPNVPEMEYDTSASALLLTCPVCGKSSFWYETLLLDERHTEDCELLRFIKIKELYGELLESPSRKALVSD